MKKISYLLLLILLFTLVSLTAQDKVTRWNVTSDGGINWKVKPNDTHMDHLEMSGLFISAIVKYGVRQGKLQLGAHLVFPMLRTIPNNTHASLSYDVDCNSFEKIKIDGKEIVEYPAYFSFKGVLSLVSKFKQNIVIKHQIFPSVNKAALVDKKTVFNKSDQTIKITIPNVKVLYITDPDKGVEGAYKIEVKSSKHGDFVLKPNESIDFSIVFKGSLVNEKDRYISVDYELKKREKLIIETFSSLVLESPDSVLNTAFSFAKIRAVESIYETKGGLMHGPGGGRYYAAIWANDQAEYANPFFPFLGNLEANESAINSFRHFARFMNSEYKPIPSSIIAEGIDIWNGAGDRGDMAMIAYGASRFALAYGDFKTAKNLWPLIEWCLEYNKRKLNDEGVVTSDSDELEGRFPSGNANLNTSSLYYDALISAVVLGKELGIAPSLLTKYQNQATKLKQDIESYFGATVSGFKTYRYFKENKKLRAWIATPLTVGILERKQGTIDALFSEKLWTVDGLASEAGSTTFWDRATLYALRGVFAAGETEKAIDYLLKYSKRRLIEEHVPYPVEAYPEGNQRHLSAESALYCRVITEGLFGLRPTGFKAFTISPKLPKGWNTMALRNIKAFNGDFDIEIYKTQKQLRVKVFSKDKVFYDKIIKDTNTILIKLR